MLTYRQRSQISLGENRPMRSLRACSMLGDSRSCSVGAHIVLSNAGCRRAPGQVRPRSLWLAKLTRCGARPHIRAEQISGRPVCPHDRRPLIGSRRPKLSTVVGRAIRPDRNDPTWEGMLSLNRQNYSLIGASKFPAPNSCVSRILRFFAAIRGRPPSLNPAFPCKIP